MQVLASTFESRNLIRHIVGLHWTSDQLIGKAYTDTGQHNL
jgi:hypothetical protein